MRRKKVTQMNFNAQKPTVMTIANVTGPETMERVGVAILRECEFDVYTKNKRMDVVIEHKGAHPKFWVYADKDTALLCKLSNMRYSIDGELIMTKVLDSISFAHVKYLPAICILPSDETAYATLSPDAIKGRTKKVGSGELEEISGRSLASQYLNFVYDTQHGKTVKYQHTVDFYVKAIDELYNLSSSELKNLRNDMLKQALIQGLFVMNDMHEENIGFLVNKSTKKMSLMPIYDYGSALQLNWNFKSTYNKSKTFNGYLTKDLQENVLQKRANNLLSSGKNNIMFGVHTPLIDANTKFHTSENDRRETFTKDSLLVLMRELAHEMQHNKELRAFYENIKRQVDFYHIRDFYANSFDPTTNEQLVPEIYIDVAEQTFKASCFMLDKEIKNAKCFEPLNENVDKILKENQLGNIPIYNKKLER